MSTTSAVLNFAGQTSLPAGEASSVPKRQPRPGLRRPLWWPLAASLVAMMIASDARAQIPGTGGNVDLRRTIEVLEKTVQEQVTEMQWQADEDAATAYNRKKAEDLKAARQYDADRQAARRTRPVQASPVTDTRQPPKRPQ